MNEVVKNLVTETVKSSLLEFSKNDVIVAVESDSGNRNVVTTIPFEFVEKYTDLLVNKCYDIITQTKIESEHPEATSAMIEVLASDMKIYFGVN